jgi:hypothetical protein
MNINSYFPGLIDFKELVCGISAACRGPQFQRYKCKSFLYDHHHIKIFD